MSRTLWGSTEGEVEAAVASFTAGEDRHWDRRLLRWDILGTMGHVEGLAAVGLLSHAELLQLRSELRSALTEADEGRFTVEPSDEDCHTALELRLTERLGEVGEKVHTGRSRNDQVMAALRLYLKHELLGVAESLVQTASQLLDFAAAHRDVLLPGYTHTRRAMPSTMALWACGFAENLLDDLGPLLAAFDLCDRSPLGSAAGYGVPLPLNRKAVADVLGFASVQHCVTSAQLSRGKLEAVVLGALWAVARDLSVLASDVILFSAEEYGFLVLPPELATGSSIMPHKRNPDTFELTRGRAGVVAGLLTQVTALAGGLPSGYHRDLQLAKGPLMQGVHTVAEMLTITAMAVPRLGVDADRCAAAVTGDLLSTDEVCRRVREGTPFRSAYHQVAAEVRDGDRASDFAERQLVELRGEDSGLEALKLVSDDAHQRLATQRESFRGALERLVNLRDGSP